MNKIDFLKKLIRIRSDTKKGANEAIEFCSDYLYKKGIDGKIIKNNGYKSYVSVIGNGKKTLVLNGHLDVVSDEDKNFEPIETNDKLYGRGTADMKSGVVAIIDSFIKASKIELNNKVMLQLVSDEETGGFNCTKHLVKSGYIGDFVICTEPTNLEISIQAKGILILDIEIFGKSAHGSRPWEGENAIIKSFKVFKKIKNLKILNIGSEYYEKSSINLARVKGGDVYNKVPSNVKMGIDIRYVPTINPDKIISEIKKVVNGKVKVIAKEPAVLVDPTNEYVKGLKEVYIENNLKKKVSFAVQHGGSDGRFFADKGIPIVEFGPCGDNWHGDKEYVLKESIEDLSKVLISFIEKF